MAVMAPKHQTALEELQRGIQRYVNATEWDGEWFLDQYVADILNGFRGLLNGPTGMLDCGELDGWACDMIRKVHHDADTGDRMT